MWPMMAVEKFFPVEKIIITGNPIRKESVDIKDKRPQALEWAKLSGDKKDHFPDRW